MCEKTNVMLSSIFQGYITKDGFVDLTRVEVLIGGMYSTIDDYVTWLYKSHFVKVHVKKTIFNLKYHTELGVLEDEIFRNRRKNDVCNHGDCKFTMLFTSRFQY